MYFEEIESMEYEREQAKEQGYDKVDESGRRYRKIGHTIEYEPLTVTSGISAGITSGELAQIEKRAKEEQAERIKKNLEEAEKMPKGACPFRVARGMYDAQCQKDCAFLKEYVCQFATISGEPVESGKKCPITAKGCSGECVMYNGGCTVLKRLETSRKG